MNRGELEDVKDLLFCIMFETDPTERAGMIEDLCVGLTRKNEVGLLKLVRGFEDVQMRDLRNDLIMAAINEVSRLQSD